MLRKLPFFAIDQALGAGLFFALSAPLAGCAGEPISEQALAGHRDFEIELAATVRDCLPVEPYVDRGLGLVGGVDFRGDRATGWLAFTKLSIEGQPDLRYTLGSSAFAGTVSRRSVQLTADVPYDDNAAPEDLLHLTMDLAWDAANLISGTAEGEWTLAADDMRWACPLTATVSGGPDTTAPGAVVPLGRRPFLPFEALAGYFTEPILADPVRLTTTAGGESVAASLALVRDQHERPYAFAIEPQVTWPEGTSVTARVDDLRDAAGNSASVPLGTFEVVSAPDSVANLGFESSLEHWITDPLPSEVPAVIGAVRAISEIEVQDEQGAPVVIEPPEGSAMALIEGGGRLIGHVVRQPAAARLRITIGVLDPTPEALHADAAGFRISAFGDDGLRVLADGSALPEIAKPAIPFSGFVTLSLELPSSMGEGIWIVIEPWGWAGPVHMPAVLVDQLAFE